MYKRLLGETTIYGIGAVLPRLINFLLTREFTTTIDESEFAIFANLYAAVSIINVLLSFGFETSYFRFSSEFKEKKVFNNATLFLGFNALIFLLIILIFLDPIASWSQYENHKEYLKWFAFIIAFDTLCVIPFAWLRYHNKPLIFTGIKLINISISLALTLVLLNNFANQQLHFLGFHLRQNVSFPFFANLVASFATLIMLFPILLKVQWEWDKELFKKMYRYSYPVMLAGLAFTLNENFDKLVQKYIIPDFEAGAYGACYKLGALMTIFVTAFRMGVEPFLFKQMKEENAKKTYATILEIFTIICGLIMLGILGNISWIGDFFIRSEGYKIAMVIVPIIIIANAFYGIYHTLSVWYKVNDQTYFGTYFSWIGAILTIIINLVFLKFYGFMASAWATIIAYGTMMILSYIVGQKRNRMPYKIRKIVLYLGLAIVLSLINYYVLDTNVITGNFFLLLYITIVYLLEKKHLLKELVV